MEGTGLIRSLSVWGLRQLDMTEVPITSAEHEQASQAAFEVFYLQTSRTLHGYLCRISRDPASADEVLQEAYIRIINAPAMDAGQRKAYLYTTATNILARPLAQAEARTGVGGANARNGKRASGI